MSHIPTYALYGERIDQSDWLHWETIPARSRLYGFHIGQHRHENLLQILLLDAGSARAQLDDQSADLIPGDVVLVPAMTVHEYLFSPDVDGMVLTLFESDARALGFAFERSIVTHDEGKIRLWVQEIIKETRRPGARHETVLEALLTLLLAQLHRANTRKDDEPAHPDRAQALVRAFRDLVEKDYRTTRNVAPFAAQLAISHTHLNRICQSVLSASAQDVINRRVATEARRYLLFSDLPVKLVASELGFDDPAYFARFVKRHLGRSPIFIRAERQNSKPKL